MPRTLKGPNTGDKVTGVRSFAEGGLGGDTAKKSLDNINGIALTEIGKANGPILLGERGLPDSMVSGLYKAQISVDGPTSIAPGAKADWYLTAFDSFTIYEIEGVLGVATLERNIVTYTAGSEAGDGGFIINGVRIHIPVNGAFISAPTISSPTENALTGYSLSLVSSAFVANSVSDTHVSSDWEVATDEEFFNIIDSVYASTTEKLVRAVSNLEGSQSYYARVRHNGATLGASTWSTTRHFKTNQLVAQKPVIISPVSGAVNLSPNVTFTLSQFVPEIETIQVPMKDASGKIVSYAGADRETAHVSTDWQIATNSSFTAGLHAETTEAGIFSLSRTGLNENQSYYLRARFTTKVTTPTEMNQSGGVSYDVGNATTPWSNSAVYKTSSSFAPSMPYIITPEAAVVNEASKLVLESSVYVSPSNEAHVSTDWELSTSQGFLSFVVRKVADTVNLTKLPVFNLSPATTYYLRARYRDASGSIGQWSNVRSFQTAYSFLPLVTTIYVSQTGSKYNFKGSNYVSPTNTPQASFDVEIRYGDTFETSVVDGVLSLNGLVVVQPDGKNNYAYNNTSGVIGDNNYWARIRYVDEDQWKGSWSAPVQFKTKTVQ